MRYLDYRVSELPNVIIPLGIQGEQKALTLRIDMTEWADDTKDEYGVIVVLNPDGVRYVAAINYDPETHIIEWTLSATDTGTYGDGALTVDFWSEGSLKKSAIARTSMLPSYYKGLGDPPDKYEAWLQTMTRNSAEAGAAAISANRSAEEAANSAAEATADAEATGLLVQTVKDAVIGQALLTEKITLSIAPEDWDEGESGYTYTIERETITAQTYVNLCVDESILHLRRCIEWETQGGRLILKTERLPSGVLSGYAALITIFEDTNAIKQTSAEIMNAILEAKEEAQQAAAEAAASLEEIRRLREG